MSKLDDILDKIIPLGNGLNERVRAIIKQRIKDLMLEIAGEDVDENEALFAEDPNGLLSEGYVIGYNKRGKDLQKEVEEL